MCYNCIAATGQSAAVLHYGHAGAPNDQTLKDGDMVSRAVNEHSRIFHNRARFCLTWVRSTAATAATLPAGTVLHCTVLYCTVLTVLYCTVLYITCSWPVNGKFSPDQKIVYNAVLRAAR